MDLMRIPVFGTRQISAASIRVAQGRITGLAALRRRIASVSGVSDVASKVAVLCAISNIKIFIAPDALYRLEVVGRMDIPSSNVIARRLSEAGVLEVTFKKGTDKHEVERIFVVLSRRGMEGVKKALKDNVAIEEVYHQMWPEFAVARLSSLQALLASPYYYAEDAARDPSTAPEVLDGLARRGDSHLHEDIAENPNVLPETLIFLCEKGAHDALELMAKKGNELPGAVREKLAHSRYESIRQILAGTTDDQELLRAFLSSGDFSMISLVGNNPNASFEVRAAAINRLAGEYDLANDWQKEHFLGRISEMLKRENNQGATITLLRRDIQALITPLS